MLGDANSGASEETCVGPHLDLWLDTGPASWPPAPCTLQLSPKCSLGSLRAYCRCLKALSLFSKPIIFSFSSYILLPGDRPFVYLNFQTTTNVYRSLICCYLGLKILRLFSGWCD